MYKLVKNKDGRIYSVNTEVGGVFYSIPFNTENTDYQEYLKWLAEGNTPEPADEQN